MTYKTNTERLKGGKKKADWERNLGKQIGRGP